MKKFLQEFKQFAMRGNIVDMAIGIIIGGAFTTIITSVTANFIQPILNLVLKFQIPTWASFTSSIVSFLSAVVNFILTAFVLFLILKFVNTLGKIGKKKEEPAAPSTKACPYCKSSIAIDAVRCPHCTSQIEE